MLSSSNFHHIILLCLLPLEIKGLRGLGVEDGSLGCMKSVGRLDTSLTLLLLYFVVPGKIYTPMEYKGELASYDMQLR
jgi:hypothetical protein